MIGDNGLAQYKAELCEDCKNMCKRCTEHHEQNNKYETNSDNEEESEDEDINKHYDKHRDDKTDKCYGLGAEPTGFFVFFFENSKAC